MKMNNSPIININIFIIGSLVSIMVYILGIFNIFSPLRSLYVEYFVDTIQAQRTNLSRFTNVSVFFDDVKVMQEDKLKLEEEIVGLNDTILDLKLKLDSVDYVLENDIVNFDIEHEIISARVIEIEGGDNGFFFLNKGSEQGIKKGAAVTLGSHIVGIVVEVEANYSKVESVSSSNLAISVICIDSNAKGILSGGGNGYYQVDEILSSDSLEVEDIFVTEGSYSKKIPFGLYVGKVREIVTDPTSPTKSALLENEINFKNIDKLSVLNTYD